METAANPPLTVIYNGACPICAREIAHYRARAERTGAALDFVDLCTTDLTRYRLSADAAARRLHVASGDRLVSGIDAFALIWARLPGFAWLARIARFPVIRPLLDVAYNRVAAPWLYRKHLKRTARA